MIQCNYNIEKKTSTAFDEELNDLYCSPNITWMIKKKGCAKFGWGGGQERGIQSFGEVT